MTKSRKAALIEIDEMFEMGIINEDDRKIMLQKYEESTPEEVSSPQANEASASRPLDTDIDLSDDAPIGTETIKAAPKKEAKAARSKKEKSIVAGALEVAKEKKFRRSMKNGGIVDYIRTLTGGKIDVGGGSLTAEDVVKEVPAVKAQDKLLDVLEGAYVNKPLTVYSRLAFDHLRAKKSLKTTEFAGFLMDTPSKGGSGYSVGTARSQAQQMHSVFKALGIIDDTDAINPKSKIVERMTRAGTSA